MDETLTSKLIELSEKLNVAIQKYERIGNDRAPQHPRRRQQRRRISSSNNNDKCNTTYSGYHPMEEVLTKPRFLHPTRSLRTHRRVFHLFDQPRPVMKRSTRFSVTVFRRTLRHNNRVGMSLREQYMLKQQQQQQQQQQQHAAQGSPSNSVISSQFLTPASSSPPSSKALNGSATPLGFEAKREKERQEATLHDPFASLAINAGLTPKKGVTTKSASSSPPTSSSGQKRVVNSEMGTPPQRPSTLQRSPTNPFDNDFKYPKI